MPKKRFKNKRKPFKRILILCEGKYTEPDYFKSFKRDRELNLYAVDVQVVDTEKNTNKELVSEAVELKKEAERERNSYDHVWVVVDKDGYTKHPEAFDKAESNDINIAFSSICFEYWFLLHFEYTTRSYRKADELIRYLKDKYIRGYEKKETYYISLKPRCQEAIINAKKVQNYFQLDLDRGMKIYKLNPYTNVNEVVELLLSVGK